MSQTIKLLMMEYDFRALIPLEEINEKLFQYERTTMIKMAKAHKFPFPCRRMGSQKSPYMVKIEDLAKYIDQDRDVREAWAASYSQAS